MDYDVLVIGGGIGGMESALSLGDMGFKVLLVEKEASIGGKMILLSKVFPTLDCASCISTPKMAATANHPNIKTLIYSEVDNITSRPEGGFTVNLHKKPTFVDLAKCTGCAECEVTCTVAIADEFNADLVGRRAAHIAFPQAVPKKAVIDRLGTSPCSYTCPAGVKPHGYISLVRAGKYAEAFRQHLEDAPLPGSLSRACYAPCEEECSRSGLEGSVSIKGIKRFMVDWYYDKHPEPEYGVPEKLKGKKVAIIGSGPTGLSAAFFLAKDGYSVTIFESDSEPGGVMRWGIPAYRLSKNLLARDIKNITALGVEIKSGHRIDSLDILKQQGFDAVLIAAGSTGGRKMSIPGENLPDVYDCMDFLKDINGNFAPDFKGKTVVVIGGGNVAIDCARSALRIGAAKVRLFCLETRTEMPAHKWEVLEAVEEGVEINNSWGARKILSDGNRVTGIEFIRCSAVFDKDGRFNPVYDETQSNSLETDKIIMAIGLAANTAPFAQSVELNRNGTIKTDPDSLLTSQAGVFAAGDAVTGPSMIVKSIGQGKRAALYIARYLNGQSLKGFVFDDRLPMVEKEKILAESKDIVSPRLPLKTVKTAVAERMKSFTEFETTLNEEEARFSANRCLDCGGCSQCRQCVSTCPAGAIALDMRTEYQTISVGSVALATGFEVFDAHHKPVLGYGRFPNVINGVQMDRILAPTRPYNAVVRPSDGKAPSNIAFVLCTGSRDEKAGNPLCSRVCCMYSLKQAQLLMGALPLADITIYYIDIRSFGKGYEEFYQQARGMGIYFTRGKVARIEETAEQDLVVHYEDIEGDGGLKTAKHDLVVLSVGMLPAQGALNLFQPGKLETDKYSYIKEFDEDLEPGKTSIDGVFVIGSGTAVRDIPDTILHSGAAAAQVAAYLKKTECRS
jgi:heterodisulfide reductase subunit A-like polyferredoxin